MPDLLVVVHLPPHEFAYELRERDRIVSVGRLILESNPEVGQTVPINGMLAAVVEIAPGPRLILKSR